MTKEQLERSHKARLDKVDAQAQKYALKIGESFARLIPRQAIDEEKIARLFCEGVMGLVKATVEKRELILKGAKEELTEFVEAEMNRVRSQPKPPRITRKVPKSS